MDISSLKTFEEIVSEDFSGVYIVDDERRILFWNKAAEEITGYTAEEMVGKSCPETGLNHTDDKGTPLCHGFCPLLKTLRDGKTRGDVVLAQTKNGGRVAVRDLPSAEKQSFAVLFLDFDDFKVINDRYGHVAGDAVLKTMARVISSAVKKEDLMGRYGGEEFVGVYMVDSVKDAKAIAERVRAAIEAAEIAFEGITLRITASIGVTMAKEGDSVEAVVRRADRMMYQSKRLGKNNVCSDDW